MKEYAFLGSNSFRQHFLAKNLKDAWRLAKAWYLTLPKNEAEEFGELTTTYSVELKDGVMSEWRTSKTLGNKSFNKTIGVVL